jgi:hypothetical protein
LFPVRWRLLAAAPWSAALGGWRLPHDPLLSAAASWSAALGGWLLPHGPLLSAADCCPYGLLLSAAGCCPTVRCSQRLTAAPRLVALGGWLLPHGLLLLAAGCCPTICCSWRLTAAPWFVALGGWRLPHGLLLLAADCCLVILQFLPAPLPSVDAVSHRNHTPHLTLLKSVASHECLGWMVAIGTWVVVVIIHGSQLTKAFISEKIVETWSVAPRPCRREQDPNKKWLPGCAFTACFGWVSLTPALAQSATTSHNH